MFNQIEHIKGTGTTNVRLLGRGQMSDFQVRYTVTESLKLSGMDIDYSLESIQYAVICQRGTVSWLVRHPGGGNGHTVKQLVLSFFTVLLSRTAVIRVLVHGLLGDR